MVLLLLFVVLLGPALAGGSSVDPTWIAGFWDAADHDEDLLAAAGLEGIPDPGGLPLPPTWVDTPETRQAALTCLLDRKVEFRRRNLTLDHV